MTNKAKKARVNINWMQPRTSEPGKWEAQIHATRGGSRGWWWDANSKAKARCGYTCLEQKKHEQVSCTTHSAAGMRSVLRQQQVYTQRGRFWELYKPRWQPRKFSLTGLNKWAALQQVEMMGKGQVFTHQSVAAVFKSQVMEVSQGYLCCIKTHCASAL